MDEYLCRTAFYIVAEEMELLINLSDTRLFMISSCFDMSNINLLQRLMKENRPPFLPFSQSCFNYFKVRGFIGFSELCIRTFHPDSQRYICPYLPDAHMLEFRLPAATIECVINKQGICIEAIMFTD